MGLAPAVEDSESARFRFCLEMGLGLWLWEIVGVIVSGTAIEVKKEIVQLAPCAYLGVAGEAIQCRLESRYIHRWVF